LVVVEYSVVVRKSERQIADRTIDFDRLELRVGKRVLPLTLMEANLLRYLIQHEGKAASRRPAIARYVRRVPGGTNSAAAYMEPRRYVGK
jgi:DNA-binding response OmpR family regulator